MGYARLAALLLALPLALPLAAEPVRLSGLRARVEVLRDQWGIPHIYAQNQDDLYFAQGYMAARDRLWQIDLWRRAGSGKLSAALGPAYLERDRTALLLRFRGDWKAEWTSYAPDTYQIARAFTNGINAYIQQGGRRTREFQQLGYEPGLWQPEDVLSRVAVFSMMANVLHEVTRARQLDAFGPAALERVRPTDPPLPQRPAPELNLNDITRGAIADFDDATDPVSLEAQGSNNWVVSGKRSTTGKPLLASDPHRALQIPSLRRTIHLVAPGINQIGAGEPALPGIALGHNESIGFGFTITGTDQQDLYVEQLSPSNLDDYFHAGVWKRMTVERHTVEVKGGRTETVECRYTVHGPVIGLDPTRRRAYVLRWVGAEPGTAGYLGALSLARAQTWPQFLAAAARFKAPAENLLYADTAGNIGFAVAGLTPIRKNWNGLFPVPGHTGTYEWAGFLDPAQLPRTLNPREGFLATANDNILPPGYPHILSYEWAPPFRAHRIRAQLAARALSGEPSDPPRPYLINPHPASPYPA
ncbi:MAG: penicillin acylase family protein [Acidobacteriota bacterium]